MTLHDSSELAFKLAASIALKKRFKKAKPKFCFEPIMKVEVETPEENNVVTLSATLAAVVVCSKRQESEATGVPRSTPHTSWLFEMLGYATQLLF